METSYKKSKKLNFYIQNFNSFLNLKNGVG